MRTLRIAIAATLLAGCIVYLTVGEHKGIGLGAGVIAAFLCRLLVVDRDLAADARREAPAS